ncbi:DUF1684 domain-containing protein [Geothrix sp. 21YS21S-4]|uniref:DUF1684 domain-containing protein n=1 Tax=Geothrix sp. 21YS21S-4 TaxID=3068889 RepID=UPI0027BA6EA0|nr:DUF1684 domain-containing protein [Geothrix sp. 21YS21S-4]
MPAARVPSVILLLLAGTLSAQPPADFLAAHGAWRAQRHRSLAAKDGWLSLVGLSFLQEGDNPAGSLPGLPVSLPGGPPRAGVFHLAQGRVSFRPEPGADVTLRGEPAGEAVLRTDAEERPDILEAGSLRFHVIRRGDRFAVRVKDTASPLLAAFKGVDGFPPDPAYRVTATFEPYPSPRTVAIPTVLGTTEDMPAPGLVRFTLKGRSYTLEPVQEDGPESKFFFIFRDATAGKETYPAGRFLYADPPKDGKLILDFNRAVNPPCAFTPFATCPLPPKQNRLNVRIPAGEKTFGEH